MLHPQFPEDVARHGPLSATDLGAFHRALRSVRAFNQANAYSRRSVCQIVRDTPVLLAELRRSLGTAGGVRRFLSGAAWLRLVCIFFPMISYVLSPLDLMPDVIPVIGQLDDVLVIVMFLVFVGSTYRAFVLGH